MKSLVLFGCLFFMSACSSSNVITFNIPANENAAAFERGKSWINTMTDNRLVEKKDSLSGYDLGWTYVVDRKESGEIYQYSVQIKDSLSGRSGIDAACERLVDCIKTGGVTKKIITFELTQKENKTAIERTKLWMKIFVNTKVIDENGSFSATHSDCKYIVNVKKIGKQYQYSVEVQGGHGWKDRIDKHCRILAEFIQKNKTDQFENIQDAQARGKDQWQYLKNHPKLAIKIRKAIINRELINGMTADQVAASWGYPDKNNKTVSGTVKSEKWIYGYQKDFGGGVMGFVATHYAYINNGILTTWQTIDQ